MKEQKKTYFSPFLLLHRHLDRSEANADLGSIGQLQRNLR